MAKKNQLWYMRQCKKTMERIMRLGPDDGAIMLRLKKKAEKYLEKAKEFEKNRPAG